MKRIVDKGVLLLMGLLTGYLVSVNRMFVAAFLVAVIFGCVSLFELPVGGRWLLTAGYVAFCLFCREGFLFTPVVLYSLVQWRMYPAAVIFSGLCLYRYGGMSGGTLSGVPGLLPMLLAVEFIAALALQYGTQKYERLDEQYRRTRDDSAERNILLEEKNQNLLERQDYEIYTATLRERNRIAREIHDNVGHMLSRSILMVGAMKTVNREAVMEEAIIRLEETLNEAMNSVRQSVHDLHDESVNLETALRGLVKDYTFCPVHLEYDMGYEIPGKVKYSFIMIVKEAMNNVIRHSNADQVRIVVREHPGLYQLIVEDNGSAGGEKEAKEDGMGILNMKERVKALGGTIQVKQKAGFCIYVTAPKGENGESSNYRRRQIS